MNAITIRPTMGLSGLVPANMAEAMQLAKMMSDCGLLPDTFRGKPGNALMVIEQAMRWGMSPFAVAQEVSVIQGKMMHSGKIVAAAIQSAPGVLRGRLSYAYTGEGDGRTIVVSGILQGEDEPREVSVRVKDAKTANKVWITQPDQQLAYHGARVWARRFAPEVMLGVYAPEEMEASPTHRGPAHTGPILDAVAEPVSRPRDAVDDDVIPVLADKQADAAARLIARIEACAMEDDLHILVGDAAIGTWRFKLAKSRPELDARIADAFGARYEALTTAEPADATEAPPVSDDVPF